MTKIPAQPSWRAIKPQFKQHLGPEINKIKEVQCSVRCSVWHLLWHLDLDCRGNFLSWKSINLVPFKRSWLTEHKSVIHFEKFQIITKMLMDFVWNFNDLQGPFSSLAPRQQPVCMRMTITIDISTSLLMQKSSKTSGYLENLARFETLKPSHFLITGPICL